MPHKILERQVFLAVASVALVASVGAAQDKYFTSGGLRLRYTEQGTGEPVVLVHGFTNTAEIWSTNGIAQDLSRDHHVIAFDLRGHGKSDKPHDAAKYGREMGLDIIRLLDHLGIQRAHIVGYSMGGHLTSQLLTLHPERFISATLIAGSGRFNWNGALAKEAEQDAAEMERECISPSLMMRLARNGTTPPSADSLKVLSATCMATQDRRALAAVTRSRVDHVMTPAAAAAVTVPTLGIVGTDDPMKAGLDVLMGIRPSVRLVVVTGATHDGPRGILGRPELIAALRDFLSPRSTSPPSDSVLRADPSLPLRVLGVFDVDTGDPIADARVIDVATGTFASTTRTGTVSLAFVPSGNWRLRIVKPGYDSLTVPVAISPRDSSPVTVVLARPKSP